MCACLAQSRALHEVVPDELLEKICEALLQLFPSMVGLCGALEFLGHTLLCGAASTGLTQPDYKAKLNECLTSGRRALIKTWTAGIILEKQCEFEGALCKAKLPLQHRYKFLPPGLSEEDLNKYVCGHGHRPIGRPLGSSARFSGRPADAETCPRGGLCQQHSGLGGEVDHVNVHLACDRVHHPQGVEHRTRGVCRRHRHER